MEDSSSMPYVWSLWRERNDRNFDNQERTIKGLKSYFFFIFCPLYLNNYLFSSLSN